MEPQFEMMRFGRMLRKPAPPARGMPRDAGRPAWRQTWRVGSGAWPPLSVGVFDVGDPGDGETPPSLAQGMPHVPVALQSNYTLIGNLDGAYAHRMAQGAGLYLIELPKGRAYSGMSEHLRQRLQRHRLCAKVMGLDPKMYGVYVATPAADLRRREYALHDAMFKHAKGVLTNTNRELEAEIFGEEHEYGCGCGKCSAFEVLEFAA